MDFNRGCFSRFWLVFQQRLNARGLSTADAFTQRPDSVVGLERLGSTSLVAQVSQQKLLVPEGLVDSVSAALLNVEGVSSVEPMRISPAIPGASTF